MVGTGRIELPTSSVSRKRSPTELRACKVRQNEVSLTRIELTLNSFELGFVLMLPCQGLSR